MKINNKKAIIFGGTSGIGLAAAEQLAQMGAEVIAVSRNPDKAGTPPERIRFEACDVLDREALQALFKKHAPFDILVSTATGGPRPRGPFLEMDLDGYEASFSKLWGYANVVRLGAEHMSQDGAIVLVSGSPSRKAKPGQAALSSVGAAIEAFARAVAAEIAPRRLNVAAPGVIDTPMQTATGEARREIYRNMTAKNVIPRAGTAAEVAQGIVFLIENDFVTGTTLDIDGGWLVT